MACVSVRGLTKRYGRVRAVDDLTFEAPPGQITGFLGPNGAGKTTTLRALVGLVRPTRGSALINGRRYDQLPEPRRLVGAVLESGASRPGRSGRDHLRVLAATTGVGDSRVEEVLDLVDLTDASSRRVSGYSMGMHQRLGLAAALLGDPEILLLDEPANGLDPEGIAWLRALLRGFASEGRTVLISSHILSEVAQTVDRVVIIDHGKLKFDGSLQELGGGTVSVRTGQADRLAAALSRLGYRVDVTGTGLEVRGATAEQIGRLAASERIALSELTTGNASLEAAFLQLTSGEREWAAPSATLRSAN
ncbi:MAG: ATP-binding cassette domain-containing protein [Candidatus Limnocylindrales bacterium]